MVRTVAGHFANTPERRHFAEYLTGLFIAERKTVSGINREFAVTTDQSCLNRCRYLLKTINTQCYWSIPRAATGQVTSTVSSRTPISWLNRLATGQQ
jgi:hypothetical protein